MRAFAILLILAGFSIHGAARAEQKDECAMCRETHRACLKNHSQGACNTEFGICMKHCRQKK
jgi:hypothetical protein